MIKIIDIIDIDKIEFEKIYKMIKTKKIKVKMILTNNVNISKNLKNTTIARSANAVFFLYNIKVFCTFYYIKTYT